MTSFALYYSKQAEKYLSQLTKSKSSKILKSIKDIGSNPLKPNNNITKLVGTKSSYRLRVGNIRVIYQLIIEENAMYVVKIAPRGSAYSS